MNNKCFKVITNFGLDNAEEDFVKEFEVTLTDIFNQMGYEKSRSLKAGEYIQLNYTRYVKDK